MQFLLRKRLEIISFVSGAVLMTVELVGSRVVAPNIGVSTFVWTSIIGVILGFLSLGYWYGGKLSDRRPHIKTLSKIIFFSFLSVSLILFLQPFVSLLGFLRIDLRLIAVLASIILFGPMSFCLGMVSPYVARLSIDSKESSGATVGTFYAISTLGSILGTFLGGFFLVSFMGTSSIIFCAALALFLIFILASLKGDFSKELSGIGLVVMLSILFLPWSFIGSVADIDTLYNRWIVVDYTDVKGQSTRLLRNNVIGAQSGIYLEDPTKLLFPYLKVFDLAPQINGETGKDFGNVLLLGAGAYTYPTHFATLYPDTHMDVVEIDGGLEKIAKDYFGFKNTENMSIYNMDARMFLKNNKEVNRGKYDIIWLDVFSSELSIPYHMTTLEAVKDVAEILDEDGVAVANVISAINGKNGRLVSALYNTYGQVFDNLLVLNVPEKGGSDIQNLILIASKNDKFINKESISTYLKTHHEDWQIVDPSKFEKNIPVLTDEFAPVELYISGFLRTLR